VIYGDCIEADGNRHVFPETLDALFLYRGTLNHQSSFIKSSLFESHLYDEGYKVASDWEFFLSKLLFGNATYQKVDVVVSVVQAGKSYDLRLSSLEREAILNKRFCLMERSMLENYAAFVDNPMRPYYDYLQKYPTLEKIVRRIVRIHRRVKCR
jgi:hypothetical protein